MKDEIEIFKSKLDIVEVAQDLGVLPERSGSRYQGETCPDNCTSVSPSKNKRRWSISPDLQIGKCFHCNKTYDVIALAETCRRTDFVGAVTYLSSTYNVPNPLRNGHKRTPEEERERADRLAAQRRTYQILGAAVEYCHNYLPPHIRTHLNNHYGLTDETIDSQMIGYAANQSGLLTHLNGLGYTTEEVVRTGLFREGEYGLYNFFNKRIIFPFWVSGSVVYLIGRYYGWTPETGKPKYKKLTVSDLIKNPIIGDYTLRGADVCFIQEGMTDFLISVQCGYPSISPVTTTFKHEDVPKLIKILRGIKKVFIVPDAEENDAGIKGAIRTALKLEAAGSSPRIVQIPRPDGVDKVDFTEFIRDHGKEAFDLIIPEARRPLELKIDAIADKQLGTLELGDELTTLAKDLARIPPVQLESYLAVIKDRLKLNANQVGALRKQTRGSPKKAKKETTAAKNKTATDQVDPEIEKINAEHAVIQVGGKVRIMHITHDHTFNRKNEVFLQKNDFLLKFLNKKLPYGEETIGKKWLEDPDRREYKGLIFAPGDKCPAGFYNLWDGFTIEPKQGDWSKFEKHIIMACSGDKPVVSYVYKWMAFIVQKLGERRPETAVVLRGGQGTGKGTLARIFGSLFGRAFFHATSMEHIVGRFNGHFKNVVLLFADEALWAGDRSAVGRFKGLITEPTITIEAKFQDAFAVKNNVSAILATNNEWAAPADLDDRRLLVIDVPDDHANDKAYFDAINQQMYQEDGLAAMLYDLMICDLTGFNPADVPKTDALMDQKTRTMEPDCAWIYSRLMDGGFYIPIEEMDAAGKCWESKNIELCWPDLISKDDLYEDYSNYFDKVCAGRRHAKKYKDVLCKDFKKYIGELETVRPYVNAKPGPRMFKLPNLKTARDYFEKTIKQAIDWEDGGSEHPTHSTLIPPSFHPTD